MTENTEKVGAPVSSGWLPDGGTITQLFGVLEYLPSLGINQPHEGIDIGTKRGSPVQTPVHATVLRTGYDAVYGAGNFVVLGLDGGQEVHLYHLLDSQVKQGQDLAPGTLLGHVDSTGASTGDHLHFEVQQAGKAVDPWTWLTEQFQAASSKSKDDPCAGKTGIDAAWCQITNFRPDPQIPGLTGWTKIGDLAAAALTPRNLWRSMFVVIGVGLIGTGVFIYFIKEETQVAKLVAVAAA